AGGPRRAAAGRFLLRPDRADLGGAVRRRHAGGRAGGAGRPRSAHGDASHGCAMNTGWLVFAAVFWIASWLINEWLVRHRTDAPAMRKVVTVLVPLLFGVSLLVLWEGITRGFNIPSVLLPPPSMIAHRIAGSIPILLADFRQTFLKA